MSLPITLNHFQFHRFTHSPMTTEKQNTQMEFPVVWPNPDDAGKMWLQDQLHCPDPMTPLDFEFMQIVDGGIDRAAQIYELPIRVEDRHINTYLYMGISPLDRTEIELEEMTQRSEEKLEEAMSQLSELWEQDWLPEIETHLKFLNEFDLSSASCSELSDHLAETVHRLEKVWEIHFLLFIPTTLAISQFEDMYLELFEPDDPLEAYTLLAGYENKTLENGLRQWKLSELLRQKTDLAERLKTASSSELDVIFQELARDTEWLDSWKSYLNEHGERSDKITLNTPTWIEDPTPVLKNIQNLLLAPQRDLITEMSTVTSRRNAALENVNEKIRLYPQAIKSLFQARMENARKATVLKEDHTHWLDARVFAATRRLILGIGARLTQSGFIPSRDDVFYLTLEEIQQALTSSSRSVSASERIDERKEIEHRFAAVTPPPVLGTEPDEPPPDDPVSRMFAKVEGEPPQKSSNKSELLGNPGSAGKVSAKVRVIHQLDEMKRIAPGEILVTESTSPAWTPFFPSLGGVVTDAGGALCHGAVIAREYGIPAVVGTGEATAILKDAGLVELDGGKGLVTILSSNNPELE